MQLWLHWLSFIYELRSGCSRLRAFFWFMTCVAGLTIRTELFGVSSIIRALGLDKKYYERLLAAFHSSSICLDKLAKLWPKVVLRLFMPVMENGRIVLVGDGIKIPKRGRKMPAVRLLHQESEDNTKPEFIMGHSFQALALLVRSARGVSAVPLASRIHQGVVLSNRDRKTLLDKMVQLVFSLSIQEPYYVVLDTYFASKKIVNPLLAAGNHLVTRVRKAAVAYMPPAPQLATGKKRGRPQLYGKKIKLRGLFSATESFQTAPSPVYGEKDTSISFLCLDLLWRPVGRLVRFVAVDHPSRGRCIFMSTDITLDALAIIRLYGLRFKIEFSFKQAVHIIGTYAYHFWMRNMKPLKRQQLNQHLHRESERYREGVARKLDAYHRFVFAGLVAQGALQYLAATYPLLVWNTFGSWLRTIRPDVPPSEFVVAAALRNSYPHFLVATSADATLAKFLTKRLDPLNNLLIQQAA